MLSEHVTIRIDRRLRDALHRRGRETGVDITALARRFIDEGLLMDRFPGLRFWQRPGGREAMLAGHRIGVADVVETVRAEGDDVEAAAAYLDIPAWLVNQALDYSAERTEEIDSHIEAKAQQAEFELAASQRRHALAR